ncbi:hypothetical protein DEIPH_ctg084orf0028 [Deinococcus phoenicis]|uniref:Uncharacterized protein n=1 Tax=Deinococcus phoenicis TaxID=1476583 RepID=A0A016QL75_9DEIO|nr:hypothetical protein [Deinococcus phoenicis]EYB66612.1 hypothetical protein DEIPH_ctg084orf0028 [Deinococcus phoenicis]
MRRRGWLIAGGGFLAGVLVACVLVAALLPPKNRIVARWDAPDGLYHALILDGGPNVMPGSFRRWRLYLGRDAGQPSYGHFVSLPELPDLYGETAAKWQESHVNWTPAGVRFTFWTGHELFVPARAYQNGR